MLDLTIKELVEGYKNKEFSPVEVTKHYLDRIRKYDEQYNSFITVTDQLALKQAEIAEKGIVAGNDLDVLHGVPVSYKDNIDTKMIKTTNGSFIDKDYIPEENAVVVSKLNRIGAVTVGKNNLYEYAMGITSANPFYGSVKNPWNTRLMAGGSSGGSAAAVAAGFCMASVGTDTAGSIRVPASCCGVVGLKPSHGLISSKGVMPLSLSLDHVGPIARNVEDVSSMMSALAAKPYEQFCKEDIRGLRVGIPKNYFNEQIEPEVQLLYQKAIKDLEALGAVILEVDLSFAKESINVASTLVTSEMGYVHHSRRVSALNRYGGGAAEVFNRSDSISSFDYIKAQKKKEKMTHQLTNLFQTADIIMTPTLPALPTEIEQTKVHFGKEVENVGDCMIRYTCLFDITGHPALTVPCGLADSGVPIGLQMIADHHREDILLNAGYAYEQAFLDNFYSKRSRVIM